MTEGSGFAEILRRLADAAALAFLPLHWTDILDIFLVAFIVYGVYRLIQETRALRILYGFLVLGAVYLLARWLNLLALKFVLESAVAIIVVAIPVVFQPELRAALERIGRGDFVQSFRSGNRSTRSGFIADLVKTAQVLSEQRIGALIVIERQTGLRDFATTGVALDALLSPEALITIFTPKSPLHDGAVIVRNSRIVAASVFLPLTDEAQDISLGTRHRAALGISKETDAVVLVVSEETGRVSLVVDGKLTRTPLERLEQRLASYLRSEARPV